MHPLRQTAEAVLPRVLPHRASSVLLAMAERYAQYRRYRRSDSRSATRRIEASMGLIVRRGPFRGMVYPPAVAYSRHSVPRLIGSYEEELHPHITRCLSDTSYHRFVDIGCAEGYYAAGFAYATRRPVHAFEIEPLERRYTRLMAEANNVGALVRLHRWCSPGALVELCPDRSFILCDCEGYETALFTAAVARALRHSDLIIELHDLPGAGTSASLLDYFSDTHEIELVTSRERRAADYPELAGLSIEGDRFVSELRQGRQQWAVVTARQAGGRDIPAAISTHINSRGETL